MYLASHRRIIQVSKSGQDNSRSYSSCYTAHINTSKYQKYNKTNQSSPLLVGEKSINLPGCPQRPVQRTDSHSVVSQGRASSQAPSAQDAWHEAYLSLWTSSHWLHRAVVLSGIPREGLGEDTARLHHSCGPPPWPTHVSSLTAPISTFAMQLGMIPISTDFLGAPSFQVHVKPLDTEHPWWYSPS